jgi:2-iminobutanoate/2-iminopropanoate deaminase
MNEIVQPTDIAPPAAAYAHAVLVTSPQRVLHTSGAIPVAPDGSVAEDLAGQCAQVWTNLISILHEADMTTDDVVSMTTYVVPQLNLQMVMAARDQALGDRLVASTLVTVAALARPAWKVEISLVAAR